MSSLTVRLLGPGECEVVHEQSLARLRTDAPPEFGGRGRSFSATDLLAAALGACVATSIDGVAIRHGVPLSEIEIRVDKELGVSPKRVSRLTVTIFVPAPTPSDVIGRLHHAAASCVVHRSLHPSLEVGLRVETVG